MAEWGRYRYFEEATVDDIKRDLPHVEDINYAMQIDGPTALHEATTHSRDVEVIKLLIEAGANVNAKDHLRYTPLHNAVVNIINEEEPNIEIVKVLLEAGADVDAKNHNGDTPIRLAVLYKRKEFVKLMETYKKGVSK